MIIFFIFSDLSEKLFVHQEVLEGIEVLGHLDALLLTLHEFSKTGWNFDVGSEDAVYLLLELGWMSGLQEDANLTWLQLLLQCLIATSSVRIKYILGFIIALLHRVCNLIILICSSADVGSDGIVVALVEVIDAGKV